MSDRLCYKCMKKLKDEQKCSCGFDIDNYKVSVHQLAPGTVLHGRYRVGVILGEGGFGITYIGRDELLDSRVAVKEFYLSGYVSRNNTISNEVSASIGKYEKTFNDYRAKFINEAKVLAKFSDEPGIVSVKDFFEENNTVYIVMEYIEGETLQSYLSRKGVLSWDKTISLFIPMMNSLDAIHKQNVIHRDISPDNIMISNNKLKLLDFGAARMYVSDANKSMSVVLKTGYAPEEQYRRHGEQGPWTDVYALCGTMYKCITGVVPVESLQRLYDDILKRPSALGIEMPKHIEDALMRGLGVKHNDRTQSMKGLINDINNVNSKSQQAVSYGENNRSYDRAVTERVNTVPGQLSSDTSPLPVNIAPEQYGGSASSGDVQVTPVQYLDKAQEQYRRTAPPVAYEEESKTGKLVKPLMVVCAVVVFIAICVVIIPTIFGNSNRTTQNGSAVEDSVAVEGAVSEDSTEATSVDVSEDMTEVASEDSTAVTENEPEPAVENSTEDTETGATTTQTASTVDDEFEGDSVRKKIKTGGDGEAKEEKQDSQPEKTYDDGINVGEYVTFGKFEQDGDTTNGAEDIEWLIMSRDGNEVLLLSRYGLDVAMFNTNTSDGAQWKNSHLRQYLNEVFINTVFSEEEKKLLSYKYVEPAPGKDGNVDDTQATYDIAYILSLDECRDLYDKSDKSGFICYATKFAKDHGVITEEDGSCYWWLRNPGESAKQVAYVIGESYSDTGTDVNTQGLAIRPVVCVELPE